MGSVNQMMMRPGASSSSELAGGSEEARLAWAAASDGNRSHQPATAKRASKAARRVCRGMTASRGRPTVEICESGSKSRPAYAVRRELRPK